MVTIRTFRETDTAEVHGLFARGQRDFAAGLEPQVEEYIRLSLAADLAHIEAHYLADPGSHFWVAELEGRVAGMVGLERLSEEEGELRRMSVSPTARRQGIGWGLLQTVERFCRQQGYLRLSLSTVTQLQPAIAMYRKNGFVLVKEASYMTMTVQYYVKRLDPLPENSRHGQN